MGAAEPRVGIVPGPGVVVRFGPTTGVFAAGTRPDEPFTAAWLDRLARWHGSPGSTAEALAWEAAELLVRHRATTPAWGTAIRIAEGYLVLLHGAVRAEIDTPAGRIELSGTHDLTWVDRRVADPVYRIALSLTRSGAIDADPRSDLRGGLVPGGSGVVLMAAPPGSRVVPPVSRVGVDPPVMPAGPVPMPAGPVPMPAGPVPPVPAPPMLPPPGGWTPAQHRAPAHPLGSLPPRPAHVPGQAPHPGPGHPPAGPVAVRSAGPPVVPVVAPAVVPVTGRSQGRPTTTLRVDPETFIQEVPPPAAPPPTATPSQASVPTPDETQVVTVSCGSLVADDGTRTILDRAYVFGRDPGKDPAVVAGYATPISVDDPDSLISRVQARIGAVGGVVTVSDANSANGTYIAAPGAKEWTRVGAVPTVLPEGWSMRLGKRIFTHAAAVPADSSR